MVARRAWSLGVIRVGARTAVITPRAVPASSLSCFWKIPRLLLRPGIVCDGLQAGVDLGMRVCRLARASQMPGEATGSSWWRDSPKGGLPQLRGA